MSDIKYIGLMQWDLITLNYYIKISELETIIRQGLDMLPFF